MTTKTTAPAQTAPVRTGVRRETRTESRAVILTLLTLGLGYFGIFVLLPLGIIFASAFQKGLAMYWSALQNPDALAAIRLTLLVSAVAVPLNLVFGVAASWLITKFDFRGKNLLITLIDLPLSVSPVISGMIFVLLFGAQGLIGPWLAEHDLKIIFAVPGILIATMFVTFPFVAREVIPVMRVL